MRCENVIYLHVRLTRTFAFCAQYVFYASFSTRFRSNLMSSFFSDSVFCLRQPSFPTKHSISAASIGYSAFVLFSWCRIFCRIPGCNRMRTSSTLINAEIVSRLSWNILRSLRRMKIPSQLYVSVADCSDWRRSALDWRWSTDSTSSAWIGQKNASKRSGRFDGL